jgi:hypothetical protein
MQEAVTAVKWHMLVQGRSMQGFAQASFQGPGTRGLVNDLLPPPHRSAHCLLLLLARVVKDGVRLMHAAAAVAVCRSTVCCACESLTSPLYLLQVGQHRPAVKGDLGKEEVDFAAAANAKVVKDAEEYYREEFAASALCCCTWSGSAVSQTAQHLHSFLLHDLAVHPAIVCGSVMRSYQGHDHCACWLQATCSSKVGAHAPHAPAPYLCYETTCWQHQCAPES